MIADRLNKGLRFIPAVVWMGVIYWLSDRPAPESSVQSEDLTMKLVMMLTDSTGMSETEKIERALYLEPYIRDIAHILEYALLAVVVVIAVKVFETDYRKTALITLIICFIYACTDEWHQYHIPGRAAQVIDVVYDTSGAVIAMFIYAVRESIKQEKNRNGTRQIG